MDKEVKLFQLNDENGHTDYIVLNLGVNKINQAEYPFACFIDLIFSRPTNGLEEEQFNELEEVEDTLVKYLEKKKAIWIGHVTKKIKREIIFYSATEIRPDDKLHKILSKDYFEVNIQVGEDPKWKQIAAFTNAIKP